MEGPGASTNLNLLCDLPNLDSNGTVPLTSVAPSCAADFLTIDAAFTHSSAHLLQRWGMLLAYMIMSLLITAFLLKHRDRHG